MRRIPFQVSPAPVVARVLAARPRAFLLAAALIVAALSLGCCASANSQDGQQAYDVVQAYLQAQASGDLEAARAFWTDVHDPGGEWTLVAGRDMDHVTREHSQSFAGGVEIVQSGFESIEGLDQPLAVLKMEVRVQPGGQLRKLEVGLVEHDGRWYIYSIYPGTW
jgi:hypothetical protein